MIPALFTSTSRSPSAASASSRNAVNDARRVTSRSSPTAPSPSCAARSRARSPSRSPIATRMPARCKRAHRGRADTARAACDGGDASCDLDLSSHRRGRYSPAWIRRRAGPRPARVRGRRLGHVDRRAGGDRPAVALTGAGAGALVGGRRGLLARRRLRGRRLRRGRRRRRVRCGRRRCGRRIGRRRRRRGRRIGRRGRPGRRRIGGCRLGRRRRVGGRRRVRRRGRARARAVVDDLARHRARGATRLRRGGVRVVGRGRPRAGRGARAGARAARGRGARSAGMPGAGDLRALALRQGGHRYGHVDRRHRRGRLDLRRLELLRDAQLLGRDVQPRSAAGDRGGDEDRHAERLRGDRCATCRPRRRRHPLRPSPR